MYVTMAIKLSQLTLTLLDIDAEGCISSSPFGVYQDTPWSSIKNSIVIFQVDDKANDARLQSICFLFATKLSSTNDRPDIQVATGKR